MMRSTTSPARTNWAALRRSTPAVAILILCVGVTLLPFLWAIANAFKTDVEIFGSSLLLPESFSFDNFVEAWTSGRFGVYFRNSLFVAVATMAITVAVACPAGYAFAKLAVRRHSWLFYVYLFALTLPAQTIIVPLFYQMRGYGLIDSLWGLSFVLVGIGTPFGVYLMRSFFLDLPDSLAEAARIDGAGEWAVFRRVMLPLSLPGILALAVFSFLSAWNEYLLALLLLVSDTKGTIPVGLVRFTNIHSSNYGALFAGIVLSMIPSILIYVALQRSFIRGLTAGADKG